MCPPSIFAHAWHLVSKNNYVSFQRFPGYVPTFSQVFQPKQKITCNFETYYTCYNFSIRPIYVYMYVLTYYLFTYVYSLDRDSLETVRYYNRTVDILRKFRLGFFVITAFSLLRRYMWTMQLKDNVILILKEEMMYFLLIERSRGRKKTNCRGKVLKSMRRQCNRFKHCSLTTIWWPPRRLRLSLSLFLCLSLHVRITRPSSVRNDPI